MKIQTIKAYPFLKWVGGKKSLINVLLENLPNTEIETYIEPFVGGGSVFFELNGIYNFKKIILNDISKELIDTYTAIRDDIDSVIKGLSIIDKVYKKLSLEDKKKMYYEMRLNFNNIKNKDCKIDIAIMMIFLNKTCFNGLYRLNSKGLFNAAFNYNNNPLIYTADNLKNVSIALNNVELLNGDFEDLQFDNDSNTFLYIDPPYRPLKGTQVFNYSAESPFDDNSQIRLANWIKKNNSIKFMLSNSDPTNSDEEDTYFQDLYNGYNIKKIKCPRFINRNGTNRGKISELLITNY